MPTPRGGHKGRLMLAPTLGAELVQVTGAQSANYSPGQEFVDAAGMDAGHGFQVPVLSKPKVTIDRIEDKAQTTVWKALRMSEAGTYTVFAFYPYGNFTDSDALTIASISGSCFVKNDHSQGMSDAIKGSIEIVPALGDWVGGGNYNPA